jgi:hypothetical protein
VNNQPVTSDNSNVTSGGKRCSKETPLIKKSNPSLFIKKGTTKEGKEKQKS